MIHAVSVERSVRLHGPLLGWRNLSIWIASRVGGGISAPLPSVGVGTLVSPAQYRTCKSTHPAPTASPRRQTIGPATDAGRGLAATIAPSSSPAFAEQTGGNAIGVAKRPSRFGAAAKITPRIPRKRPVSPNGSARLTHGYFHLVAVPKGATIGPWRNWTRERHRSSAPASTWSMFWMVSPKCYLHRASIAFILDLRFGSIVSRHLLLHH